MRRTGSIAALAFALALTLLGRAAPASADTVPQPARAAPASPAPASNLTADQFDSWAGLGENQWLEALEEGCVKTGTAACKMTNQQAHKLLSDTQKLTREMHNEIMNNPEEVAQLKALKKQNTRAVQLLGGKAVATISKFAKNPAVKNLNKYADKIGDVAGHTVNGTYAADGLTEATQVSISKAIVYMVPVVGDVWSLGEAIADRDVESGAVAVISLIATAVAFIYPPAGAVLATALAAYYVAKMILGFLCAKERDWIAEPPGTQQELFESGADIRWETHRVAGKDVAAIIPPTGAVKQTLLLDSKWTQYNIDRKPVKYSLNGELAFSSAGYPKSVTIWQGGRQAGSADCAQWSNPLAGGLGSTTNGVKILCQLKSTATISLGHPAIMVLEYKFPEKSPCSGTPCVPSSEKKVRLSVESENKVTVNLSLPFRYAFISSLSEVYASGEITYTQMEESSEGEEYFVTESIRRLELGKCYNFPSPAPEVKNSTDRKATVWHGEDCKGTKVTIPVGGTASSAGFESVMVG
ncbi:hypothetical protein ACIPLC_27715 [Kitasatospora sp. NPDC086801]|uniref:hypothetical protein n=1 Tax=Kitasatospora sp. NPDC086801 TaxID=3364066 RepID=UPI0037F35241